MKKCVSGVSCKGTCISKNKKCRKKLSPAIGGMLDKVSKSDPYQDWEPLARGYQGEILINPEKTRVVKRWLPPKEGEEEGRFSKEEIRVATKMGELGHSPRIYSSSEKHLEMDLAEGAPLWKSFQRAEGEPSMNTTQARKAGYAFRDLHRMGYAHGDAHSLQFIVNKDNVKLVDFGLIVSTRVQPNRVLQDLNKIAKLVVWDNPELVDDPYFRIVNRHLSEYQKVANSTSKAANLKKIKIAEEYLQDLRNLE